MSHRAVKQPRRISDTSELGKDDHLLPRLRERDLGCERAQALMKGRQSRDGRGGGDQRRGDGRRGCFVLAGNMQVVKPHT
jgi:hypothetical protein